MAMSDECRAMVCDYLQNLINKVKDGTLTKLLHTSDRIDTGTCYVCLTQISYLELEPYSEN
jgi:hypothetical protein